MSGMSLDQIAGRWLRARVSRSGDMPAAELFSRLWRSYRRLEVILKAARYVSRSYHLPAGTSGFYAILKAVRARHPDYMPALEIANPGVLRFVADRANDAIVVTIHNGISTSIMEVLQSRGRQCSLMTTRRGPGDFERFTLGNDGFGTIHPDQNVLLRARRGIRSGTVIFCHADSLEQHPTERRTRLRIGRNIFEFARKIDVRVFYGIASVSERGAIVVRLVEPGYRLGRCSASEMVEDFVAFLHATLGCPRGRIVC